MRAGLSVTLTTTVLRHNLDDLDPVVRLGRPLSLGGRLRLSIGVDGRGIRHCRLVDRGGRDGRGDGRLLRAGDGLLMLLTALVLGVLSLTVGA